MGDFANGSSVATAGGTRADRGA